MKIACVVIASSLLLCACALAQGVPAAPGAKVFFSQQSAGPGPEMAPPGNVIFHTQKLGDGKFTTSYVAIGDLGKPVTDAPYTATASTETTQVLADGNRIVNKTTTLLARDSQGRTRREEAMDAIGPLAVKGPRMVFINDPVAKATYILDLNRQTADVIQTNGSGPVKQVVTKGPIGVGGTRVNVERKVILRGGPEAGADRGGPEAGVEQRVFMISDEAGQAKTESLGTQVIEGVTAEGKRVTRTIPAGQIGNERPIEITSEVWTSPELQMIIMSKRNDPRVGETVYRLTDIKRVEPEHSLFEVPANFSTGMKSVD